MKLVQLGEDGLACEGGVCAIPEPAANAGSAKEKQLAQTNQLAVPAPTPGPGGEAGKAGQS